MVHNIVVQTRRVESGTRRHHHVRHTIALGFASRLELHTDLAELLPASHPAVAALAKLAGRQRLGQSLVVLVESPGSVSRGLQRIGRAGHQVGEPSTGKIFPKYRGDLLETAVVVGRMREGAIEHTRVPRQPLDVLAQQLVATTVMDDWSPPLPGPFLYYPSRRQMPGPLRAFVDFLKREQRA